MTTVLDNIARTIHLPTHGNDAPAAPAKPAIGRKSLRLSDLKSGETGRVLKVITIEQGCRKRFAELGLAPGMKITVSSTGNTLMLIVGSSRMGLAARCADEILVSRVS